MAYESARWAGRKAAAVGLGVAVAAVCWAGPALAQQAEGSTPAMAQKETSALFECFRGATAPLIAANSTPERFKLAMDGACLREEQAVLEALEAHLSTMDGGYKHITQNTMADLRVYVRSLRAEIVSNYVVEYERRSILRGK